jgi:hypothetical protein
VDVTLTEAGQIVAPSEVDDDWELFNLETVRRHHA